MAAGLTVSVVLPTFRRGKSLSAALDALAGQLAGDISWELVVVDNDDPPGCHDLVATGMAEFPVQCRYVRAPMRGACHARNVGISAARGKIIVFCDDDVVPQAQWLSRLVEPLLSGRFDGAAGRVDLAWTCARPRWLSDSLDGYLASFSPHREETELGSDEFVLTANAAFHKEALCSIGGLDPILGPRDGTPLVNDDVDLYRRFRAAGGRVCFVPEAVVFHELPESRLKMPYLIRRVYAQGRSDFRLERGYFMHTAGRGFKEAGKQLFVEFDHRVREGVWHTAVAYRMLCDIARFLGFGRESLASLRRSWEGHAPPPTAMPCD